MLSIRGALNQLLGLVTITAEVMDVRQLAATTDYAAEDILSSSVTVGNYFILENMAKKVGGFGEIRKAEAMISTTALTPRITLYLFNQIPTGTLTDNSANNNPTISDWPGYQGQIDFLALEDLGGVSSSLITGSTYGNLPLLYKCADTKRIYGIAVTRDAITGEAAGMTLGFKLQIKQD